MKAALKIVCKDGNPNKAEVWLNHRKLDYLLSEVEVRLAIGSIPTAILTGMIDDVEIDLGRCQVKFNGCFINQDLAYQVYQDLKKFFEKEIPPGFLGLKMDD